MSTKECPVCSKAFTPWNKAQVRCSTACTKARARKRIRYVYGTCPECSTEWRHHRSGKSRHRYCSSQCGKMAVGRATREGTALKAIRARPLPDLSIPMWVRLEAHRIRKLKGHGLPRRAIAAYLCADCGAECSKARTSSRRLCLPCTATRARAIKHRAKSMRRHALRVGEKVDPIAIFDRDGWTCQGCGIPTPREHRGKSHWDSPELDHIVALAVGGKHEWSNLQCLCRRCNIRKGAGGIQILKLNGF